jgi:type I restriction enzyme S subunit
MSLELRNRWEHAGGRIPEEWEIVPLENLLLDSKSITVGVMYPGADTIGGVPLIKVGDIKQGYIPNKPSYCISAETNHEHKRSQLQGEELLITLVGNPGECVVVTPHMIGWNPARAIATVRLKDSTLRVYLKTVLESAAGKHMIDAVLNTTVQKTLNLKDIKQLPIPMPPSATIKALSEFSQALSGRITLLRETNATLEAIAQALFKSWFVDFDPVHAKAQGRQPEGMDEQTAALFPDRFVESELGMVPLGWEVGTLKDVVKVIDNRGKTPPYQDIATQYPIIEVNALKGDDRLVDYSVIKKYVSEETFNSWFRGHPKKFDTLIATVGSIGATSMFLIEKGSIAQNVIALTPMSLSPIYLFQYLKKMKGEIKELDIGSVQPSIKVPHLLATKILVPSVENLSAFDSRIECCLEQIAVNYEQTQTLTNLRDTLLPRLISGQLRLPDVEA